MFKLGASRDQSLCIGVPRSKKIAKGIFTQYYSNKKSSRSAASGLPWNSRSSISRRRCCARRGRECNRKAESNVPSPSQPKSHTVTAKALEDVLSGN